MDAETLKKIPLFSSLSDEALRALSLTVREVSVSEGTHVVDEGNYSYDLSVIEEGSAEVRRGEEVIAQLGPGDFFGEMGVIEKAERNATVIATSRVRLISLTAWDLRRLRQQMPEVVERVRQAAAERSAQG